MAFDLPEWHGNDITSDIIVDFYLVAQSITSLTKEEKEKLYYSENMTFQELKVLLKKHGYSKAKELSTKLIELYSQQNQLLEEKIQKLTKQKLTNAASNNLTYMLGIIPPIDNTYKILKYERSLQKSIFQNLFMLKKLQGAF